MSNIGFEKFVELLLAIKAPEQNSDYTKNYAGYLALLRHVADLFVVRSVLSHDSGYSPDCNSYPDNNSVFPAQQEIVGQIREVVDVDHFSSAPHFAYFGTSTLDTSSSLANDTVAGESNRVDVTNLTDLQASKPLKKKKKRTKKSKASKLRDGNSGACVNSVGVADANVGVDHCGMDTSKVSKLGSCDFSVSHCTTHCRLFSGVSTRSQQGNEGISAKESAHDTHRVVRDSFSSCSDNGDSSNDEGFLIEDIKRKATISLWQKRHSMNLLAKLRADEQLESSGSEASDIIKAYTKRLCNENTELKKINRTLKREKQAMFERSVSWRSSSS